MRLALIHLTLLRTADDRGVIEWRDTGSMTHTHWKRRMRRLHKAGLVTERAGGGYNLTPAGLTASKPAADWPDLPKPPAAAPPPTPKKPRAPRIPKLTPASINKLVADLPRRIAEQEADEKDRRALRGKYAPATGTCRVCGGIVRAEIRFPHTDLIGGPPLQGYVSRFYCEGCQIVYRDRPTTLEPK